MRETFVTVAGVVATDPQVRTLDDGRQVMSFRLASTSRRFDNQTRAWVDGHTLWVKVSCWRELADNASHCVRKRDRVLAWGRLHTEQWKGTDGSARSDLALDAEALGHDLTFGVSLFERKRRAVAQRTLTDVPGFDPETGAVVPASTAAPEPELDELDDELKEVDDETDGSDGPGATDGPDGTDDGFGGRPADPVVEERARELLASA
jgi:single-strand DNA-binding protein